MICPTWYLYLIYRSLSIHFWTFYFLCLCHFFHQTMSYSEIGSVSPPQQLSLKNQSSTHMSVLLSSHNNSLRSDLLTYIPASMSHNSQLMQFTHLKCAFNCFAYRVVQPSSQSILEYFSSPQNETPYPLAVTPHFLPPYSLSQPQVPPMHFLSLWICFFWTLRVDEILQYAVFCD